MSSNHTLKYLLNNEVTLEELREAALNRFPKSKPLAEKLAISEQFRLTTIEIIRSLQQNEMNQGDIAIINSHLNRSLNPQVSFDELTYLKTSENLATIVEKVLLRERTRRIEGASSLEPF